MRSIVLLSKRQLTSNTKDTLLLGVAGNGERTAVTGALRLDDGNIEPDVIELVGDDLWATLVEALDDVRIIYAKHLLILTTHDGLCDFLKPPLYVEQTKPKKVRLGRQVFTARTGGNEYQWRLLRQLFCYIWRCERVAALVKAEEMLNE